MPLELKQTDTDAVYVEGAGVQLKNRADWHWWCVCTACGSPTKSDLGFYELRARTYLLYGNASFVLIRVIFYACNYGYPRIYFIKPHNVIIKSRRLIIKFDFIIKLDE